MPEISEITELTGWVVSHPEGWRDWTPTEARKRVIGKASEVFPLHTPREYEQLVVQVLDRVGQTLAHYEGNERWLE